MIQYGFQRLALLNSAGYRRAELPLDAAVSLIAPNNTGKTSLINALQFLLIIDKRRMDFGAHDFDTSRRFYFPHNSAYILLEVALPGTGTVVLGCVGKGVSHDYEYFAYKGPLDLEDYRRDDGSQVKQPQLRTHMAERGKLVFSYSSSDFAATIYGGRRKLMDQEPDFTVFKLEHASNAESFQRVLTRTLRLDKLRSSEVKDYLLAIFRRDLPDSTIDFKAEWDKAFSEVNADRAQYDATVRQKNTIDAIQHQQSRRLELRGRILHLRPLVDKQLETWQDHFTRQHAALRDEIAAIEQQQSDLQLADRDLAGKKNEVAHTLRIHHEVQARQNILANEFALITTRRILEEALATERKALELQTALVQNAGSRSTDAIRRDIQTAERERDQLQREIATLTDNLYLHLKASLPPAQLDLLNRVLNAQTMTLGKGDFSVSANEIRMWLDARSSPESSSITLPGLTIFTERLSPQHTQRSQDEIAMRLGELAAQLDSLSQQMAAAHDLDKARHDKTRLDEAVRVIEAQLIRFDELRTLIAGQAERTSLIEALTLEQTSIEEKLGKSTTTARTLREIERQLRDRLNVLEINHRQISRLRDERRDHTPVFAALGDLPHQPWIGSIEITPDTLVEVLLAYQHDCEELTRLDRDLDSKLIQLHAGGLTKFQFTSGSETEIQRIIEFAAHLSQEAQAIERKARSAVVNVTACLRELRDGLDTFKSRMREFNRLINRRQLSDLSVFKIEPVDEHQLVEAIGHLINTAEQTNSGETFELFNHGSVLDDATLNRAKNLLIQEGEARGCLRVEHFFRLEFVVGKIGRKEESFADMDSAASNGTVLMAKLVTGLALLHLMQDKRHKVQAVCYLDEASALDQRNQQSLVETAQDFGYALIFASPMPLVTARYCIPIASRNGFNHISRTSWQIFEPLDQLEATSLSEENDEPPMRQGQAIA